MSERIARVNGRVSSIEFESMRTGTLQELSDTGGTPNFTLADADHSTPCVSFRYTGSQHRVIYRADDVKTINDPTVIDQAELAVNNEYGRVRHEQFVELQLRHQHAGEEEEK